MNFNEAVQRSIEDFEEFVTSGNLQRQERDYKERLIRILGAALSDEAIASPDFIAQLREAVNKTTPAIANLTHFTIADDLKKYLSLVNPDRLKELLTRLFDRNVPLAERFNAFDVQLNADYDKLIEKGKRSGWLTSLLLTARFSKECTFFRNGLVKFAQEAWDCDVSDKGTRGERYVAYVAMVEQVRQLLSAMWRRPADLIDAHSFLWIARSKHRNRDSWREKLVQWSMTHPKTIPAELLQLREDFNAKFPKDKIGELTLEQYAPGQASKDNFCYWLEFKTASLGRIGVGSAYHFGVYWSQKDQRWLHASAYEDEHDAIQHIRSGLEALVQATEAGRFDELDSIGQESLGGFLGLRCKPLYLYFPEEFLPIAQPEHLEDFLRKFGAQPAGEVLALNRQLLLLLRSLPEFEGMDNFQIGEFLYRGLEPDQDGKKATPRVWKVAPGPEARHWEMCQDRECILVGWPELPDFRKYPNRDAADAALVETGQKAGSGGQIVRFGQKIRKGDIVVANKGIDRVVGVGKVVSDYLAPADRENPSTHEEYCHARLVDWVITEPLNLGKRLFPQHTVSRITTENWEFLRDRYLAQNPALADAFARLTGTSTTPAPPPPPPVEVTTDYSAGIGPLIRLATQTRNFILYGPPGTGKTFLVRQFANEHLQSQVNGDSTLCTFVTFHQSFAYEEFVEGLKPVSGADQSGTVSYRVMPGVFKQICERAEQDWTTSKEKARKYVLVIDEINRANIAKVFGELITLLEDDKRLGQPNELRVQLPYSGQSFGIPPNLYVVGTMNTADRSIALLDLALRRRFSFLEVEPDPALLSTVADVDLGKLLTTLNERIELLLDRDHRIGHSYFMKVTDEASLHFAWSNRVVPLLQEYFYNNNPQLHGLLGDLFLERTTATKVPAEMENLIDTESPRFKLKQMEPAELTVALNKWLSSASQAGRNSAADETD